MMSENQPPSPCDVTYSQFSVDAKRSADSKSSHCQCCKRYCFKGYFWAAIGGICFFIIMPAGILLIVHGYSKGIVVTLCLGVLILVLSICVLPGAYIGLHHWRRRRVRRKRMRRLAMNAIKEQAAFNNDTALISPRESIPDDV